MAVHPLTWQQPGCCINRLSEGKNQQACSSRLLKERGYKICWPGFPPLTQYWLQKPWTLHPHTHAFLTLVASSQMQNDRSQSCDTGVRKSGQPDFRNRMSVWHRQRGYCTSGRSPSMPLIRFWTPPVLRPSFFPHTVGLSVHSGSSRWRTSTDHLPKV